MCTSVASRVHGTTGLPCSSLPWWLRMMCSSAGRVRGEGLDLLDRAAHAVVAERYLALQLAGVGQLDRAVGWRRSRSCRCRAAALRRPRCRGRCRGTSRPSRSRPGRPTGSARAARGGRPGGSTWPPAPRANVTVHVASSSRRSSSSAQVLALDGRDQRLRAAAIWRTGSAVPRRGRLGRTRPRPRRACGGS